MAVSAKKMVEAGGWVTCWICEKVFRQRRETGRYCSVCDQGYCEVHGSFAHTAGKCVVCLLGTKRKGKEAG